MRTHERDRLQGEHVGREARPEDYLVNHLRAYPDVSYGEHADLLYDLAGQVVGHVRSYLFTDTDVTNVLQYHGKRLADLVHTQMQGHYQEETSGYEVNVVQGFSQLRANSYPVPADQAPVHFRQTVEDLQRIRRVIFDGFGRCLYPAQKFDSDTERKFAVLFEDDDAVLKWFKPARTQLSIHYRQGHYYEPDFIVETKTQKVMREPKQHKEMNNDIVLAKARATALWCAHASEHACAHGAKPWSYLLIPHDAITANATLAGLAAQFTFGA